MRKREVKEKVDRISDLYADDVKKQIREWKLLIKEGQKTGDVILMGSAYYRISKAYYTLDDTENMFTNALKAAELLKETDAYEELVSAYVNMGYVYGIHENNQMALEIMDKAYQIVREHRIKGYLEKSTINNLATCYHMLGDCTTGIKLLAECVALTKADPQGDYSGLAMYQMNLADCHKDNGELEKAKAILEDTASILDKVNFEPLVCDFYLRYAIIIYMLGDHQTGNQYVEKAFPLIPKKIYPDQIYDDLRVIMGYALKNGDLDIAQRIFELASAYAKKNQGTVDQLIAMRTLADYHDYYDAIDNGNKALVYHHEVEKLYEKRLNEMKSIHLKVYRSIQNANAQAQKMKKKIRKNEELLSLEPMTKLLNRTSLLATASEFIQTAAQKKRKIGAIFIDIDCFKECNDTYGHAVGDEIIRTVARACQKEEKANIRFARYGGDEFFGITRGLSDEEIKEVAARICRRIRLADIPNEKNPNGQRVTLSVGVVNVPVTECGVTIIEIAKMADCAVYHAKKNGRNAIYQLEPTGQDKKEKNATFAKIEF